MAVCVQPRLCPLMPGHTAGAAYAQRDVNEGDLKAQALASDKKTSNLPTFKDIGKALSGQAASAPGTLLQTTSYAAPLWPRLADL